MSLSMLRSTAEQFVSRNRRVLTSLLVTGGVLGLSAALGWVLVVFVSVRARSSWFRRNKEKALRVMETTRSTAAAMNSFFHITLL